MPSSQPDRALRPISEFKILGPETRCQPWEAACSQERVSLRQARFDLFNVEINPGWSDRQELGHTCHQAAPPCVLPDAAQISESSTFKENKFSNYFLDSSHRCQGNVASILEGVFLLFLFQNQATPHPHPFPGLA